LRKIEGKKSVLVLVEIITRKMEVLKEEKCGIL